MIKRSLALLFLSALILSACAPAAKAPAASEQRQFAAPAAPEMPAAPSLDQAAGGANPYAAGNTTEAQPAPGASDTGPNRVVIKNANMSIVVDDPAQSMDKIGKMAEGMGGFVVTSNLFKTTTDRGVEVPEANITVRVPAEKLDDAMAQIKALVKNPIEDIRSEEVSGQDVTKEYTDLQSRLTNLQNAEAQLREIMASATRTEDVLAVYNQLTQVREQIEVIQGQIKYYDDSARLSAIAINLIAQASVSPLTIGGWQPAGVARDALQALVNALKFFANAGIWIVIFVLPVLVVIAIPIYVLILIIRALVRRSKAAKAAPPAPPAPPQAAA
jgi:PBP1b-binding outer membrane lipoprotein LpoB